MTLLLSHPLHSSDELLMGDDERRAFLTPRPKPDLWALYQDTPTSVRFASDVRKAARRQRDADMHAEGQEAA